jgi:hypothetical protein
LSCTSQCWLTINPSLVFAEQLSQVLCKQRLAYTRWPDNQCVLACQCGKKKQSSLALVANQIGLDCCGAPPYSLRIPAICVLARPQIHTYVHCGCIIHYSRLLPMPPHWWWQSDISRPPALRGIVEHT